MLDESFMFTVPVIVDDVKRLEDFDMTRCTYFSVECSEPQPHWYLGLRERRIPILLLGLSGIITGPNGPYGGEFHDALAIQKFFDLIEENPGMYIDINDVWLPNYLLGNNEIAPGNVYRLRSKLFSISIDFRNGLLTKEEFERQGKEYRDQIDFSPGESRAFRSWTLHEIDIARRNYHEHREKFLPRQ
jgi:hypothetical protein